MTAGEVVLLADVVGDAVELLAAGVVGVDQLPRSLADGAVEADAGAAGVPDIGEVPDEGAVGGGRGAPSVNVHRGCRDFMAFYSCFYCDAITSL